jgi:hypothetical protein
MKRLPNDYPCTLLAAWFFAIQYLNMKIQSRFLSGITFTYLKCFCWGLILLSAKSVSDHHHINGAVTKWILLILAERIHLKDWKREMKAYMFPRTWVNLVCNKMRDELDNLIPARTDGQLLSSSLTCLADSLKGRSFSHLFKSTARVWNILYVQRKRSQYSTPA